MVEHIRVIRIRVVITDVLGNKILLRKQMKEDKGKEENSKI